MVKPTIDEMVKWLDKRIKPYLDQETLDLIPAKAAHEKTRDVLIAIRDQLLTHQSNTLPLDEVQEGWRLRFGTEKCGKDKDQWVFILSEITDDDRMPKEVSGQHKDMATALRAAIAKVKS